MKLSIVAAGRIRSGPERALVDDYAARTTASGRTVALGPLEEVEVELKKSDKAGATAALLEKVPPGAALAVLDERGKPLSSADIAATLAAWRDGGRRDAAFLVGGADGLDAEARRRADLVLAFGPQTWPHKLVRVMLAEQIYRAVSICAGSPYHRE